MFRNGHKSLRRNSPNCPILCNWGFDDFILAEKLFAKSLWNLKICVLVNNNVCRKLFLSLQLPITFEERFKVTSVTFLIPYFDLLSCELGNFTREVLYWVIFC